MYLLSPATFALLGTPYFIRSDPNMETLFLKTLSSLQLIWPVVFGVNGTETSFNGTFLAPFKLNVYFPGDL